MRLGYRANVSRTAARGRSFKRTACTLTSINVSSGPRGFRHRGRCVNRATQRAQTNRKPGNLGLDLRHCQVAAVFTVLTIVSQSACQALMTVMSSTDQIRIDLNLLKPARVCIVLPRAVT